MSIIIQVHMRATQKISVDINQYILNYFFDHIFFHLLTIYFVTHPPLVNQFQPLKNVP